MNGTAAKSLPRLHCGKQQWRPASEITFFHMPYQLILIESFLWGIICDASVNLISHTSLHNRDSFRRGCWRFLALVSHAYMCTLMYVNTHQNGAWPPSQISMHHFKSVTFLVLNVCAWKNSAFAWVTVCACLCVSMNPEGITLRPQVWFLRLRIQVATSRGVLKRCHSGRETNQTLIPPVKDGKRQQTWCC